MVQITESDGFNNKRFPRTDSCKNTTCNIKSMHDVRKVKPRIIRLQPSVLSSDEMVICVRDFVHNYSEAHLDIR